jgi:hypothetical protein
MQGHTWLERLDELEEEETEEEEQEENVKTRARDAGGTRAAAAGIRIFAARLRSAMVGSPGLGLAVGQRSKRALVGLGYLCHVRGPGKYV